MQLAVGESVGGWTPPNAPTRMEMVGHYCRLEPLDLERHTSALWDAFAQDREHLNWTYLSHGPYQTKGEFAEWVAGAAAKADPMFFAVIDVELGKAVGVAAYLRIDQAVGSMEVGHIHFSPLLQRRTAATEAMYLMMRHAFELGYRRYEWKCDALNAASRAAAARLGFVFEGIFRQATIYKGRSRDTAWYSVIDKEWPTLRAAFEQWLSPENFDESGRQRTRLSAGSRGAAPKENKPQPEVGPLRS